MRSEPWTWPTHALTNIEAYPKVIAWMSVMGGVNGHDQAKLTSRPPIATVLSVTDSGCEWTVLKALLLLPCRRVLASASSKYVRQCAD